MLSRVRDHSNYAHMAMHVCVVVFRIGGKAGHYYLGYCTFRLRGVDGGAGGDGLYKSK